MRKFIQIILILVTIYSSAQAELCEELARQGALQEYFEKVGHIQGLKGARVVRQQSLNASEPLFSYLIRVYDNFEDGSTWTINYFVITKLENNECILLFVAPRP